jgi:hypothetical protein
MKLIVEVHPIGQRLTFSEQVGDALVSGVTPGKQLHG